MSTLVKFNPFPSFGSMMEDFWNTDSFFGKSLVNIENMPSVNIIDKKDHYEVDVAAPGYKKDDFKITADEDTLTISAETKTETKEEKADYLRQEFSYESFTRTFHLPDNIEAGKIEAVYSNGMLNIRLKKSAKSHSNKKEIKIE